MASPESTTKRQPRQPALPGMKWCNRGQHYASTENFSKAAKYKDGLQIKCKDCAKAFYQENREQALATKRRYWAANKEKFRSKRQAYYEKNKPRINAANNANRTKKRAEYKERDHRYYEKNKLSILRRVRRYFEENREKINQKALAEYHNNPAKRAAFNTYSRNRRARKRQAAGRYTLTQWEDKCAYWGWRCYLCGSDLSEGIVHADHRKPLSKGGSNWISNIAPACQRCNLSKHKKTEAEFREWLRVMAT